MIIAKAETEHTDWQYTDAIRNYLYSLLNNTIYSEEKRREYEFVIQGELSQDEYEGLKYKFKIDKIDSITMKGAGNATEIKNRIGKLK